MTQRQTTNGERGASEIYGTFLIISIVLVTALAIIGVGTLAFQNLGDEADDDVTQQSMLELEDRLSDIAGGDIDSSQTLELPSGSGTNVEAQPNHGTINITVATNETVWNADNDIVRANNRVNSTEYTLGTIVYESEDGLKTAYQAGAVWEKQGDLDNSTELITAPNMDIRENQIELSLIDISDLEVVSQGDELQFDKNADMSAQMTEQVANFIERHRQDDQGNPVSKAAITINITSEYAQGWAEYAVGLEGLSTNNVTVHENPNGYDTVELELGEYGENLVNLSNPPSYGDDVIYSGQAQYAENLYNSSAGEIQDGSSSFGFNVSDNNRGASVADEHTVAMLFEYNDRDPASGTAWWMWNRTTGEWVNAEDPNRDPISGYANIADNTTITSNKLTGFTPPANYSVEYGNNPMPFTCVVNKSTDLQSFGQNYIDSAGSGCLKNPIGIENPGNYVGDFEPYYEIDSATFEVQNINTGNQATNAPFEVGDYEIVLNVSGTNRGTKAGVDVPVAFVGSNGVGVSDPRALNTSKNATGILDATRNDTAIGGTFEFNTTFEPTTAGNYSVSASTAHDDVPYSGRKNWTFIDPDPDVEFNVTIVDINSPSNPVTVGSDTYTIETTVENEGNADGTQPVYLRDDDDMTNDLGIEMVSVDSGNSKTVTFQWTPRPGDESIDQINVSSLNQTLGDDGNVNIVPAAGKSPNFEVDWVDPQQDQITLGDTVSVEAHIENTGDLDGTQTVLLRQGSSTVDGQGISLDKSSESGSSGNVLLQWTPTSTGMKTLNVTTNNDYNNSAQIEVLPEQTQSEFNVTVNQPNTNQTLTANQDTLSIEVTVENEGSSQDTKEVWIEDITGQRIGSQQLTLAPGETRVLSYGWGPTDADIPNGKTSGPITAITVDHVDEQNVTVKPQDVTVSNMTVDITSSPNSVIEGKPVTVTAEITNVGNETGDSTVLLNRLDNQWDAVNVTSTGSLDPGDSVTAELTWYTLVGDSGENSAKTYDLNVTASDDLDGGLDSTTVDVKPKKRSPVDVVFVIDETGSMGQPGSSSPETDHFGSPKETIPVNAGDQHEVPDDEIWVAVTEETWFSWFQQGTYYEPVADTPSRQNGLTFNGDYNDDPAGPYYEWYPGENFTVPSNVAAQADHIAKYETGSGQDPLGQRMTATRLGIGQLNESLSDAEGINENDHVGIVQYDTQGVNVIGMTDNFDQVNESLTRQAAGGTNIAGAMQQGEQLLQSGPNEDKYIIVLTDGAQSVDWSGYSSYDDCNDGYYRNPSTCAEMVNESAEQISNDIRIDTVGFGGYDNNPNDKNALEYAATQGTGEGELHDGNTPSNLKDIFPDLLSDITAKNPPKHLIQSADGQAGQDPSSPVMIGDTVQVEATVRNVNQTQSQQPILLENDVPVDGATVNAPSDGTDSVTFSWTPTEEQIDFGNQNKKNVSLRIRTPDDTREAYVWVERPPAPDLNVTILDTNADDPNDPLVAGNEDLEVDIRVENEGGAMNGPVQVDLERGQGSGSPTGENLTVNLDAGQSTEETLTWSVTEAGRDIVDYVTARAPGNIGDKNTTEVYIEAVADESAKFDARILRAPGTAQVGDTVPVEAQIRHKGNIGTSDDAIVRLLVNDTTTSAGPKAVNATRTGSIDPGDTTTLNLSWWTQNEFDRTYDLIIEVNDGKDVAQITLDSPPTGTGNFQPTIEATNANETAGESIIVGQQLNVNATVRNTGQQDDGGTQLYYVYDDGSERAVWGNYSTLANGEELLWNLTRNPTNSSIAKLKLETPHGTDEVPVDIQPRGTAQYDISVTTNATQSANLNASRDVEITVNVTNVSAQDAPDTKILGLKAIPPGGDESDALGIGWQSVTLQKTKGVSNKNTVTFIWDTRARYGNDNTPWTIVAYMLGSEGTGQVWLDEVGEYGPVGPGFGDGGDDIGIGIEDIEVS
jgi:hypothetical protein